MSRPSPSTRGSATRALLALTLLFGAGLTVLAALRVGGSGADRIEPLALGEFAAAEPAILEARGGFDAPAASGRSAQRVSASDPEEALLVVAASATGAWSGVVRERGSGRALAGAVLTLADGEWEVSAETGADGAFALDWPLAAGVPFAEAAHPGHAPARRPRVDLDRPGLFELEACAALAGVVRGPAPATARILVWDLRRDEGGTRDAVEVPVGSDGRFELRELAPGEYSVAALASGFGFASDTRLTLLAGERRELVFQLEPSARLRGLVRRDADGPPVAGARIRLRPERQGLSRAVAASAAVEVESAADGSFVIAELSPGSNRLEIHAPWGARASFDLYAPSAGSVVEREFVIARPGSVSGRVVDRRGAAVAEAWVLAAWEGSTLSFGFDGEEPPSGGGVLRTRSDAAGRFAFDELPTGRELRLMASDARVALEASSGFTTGLRLRPGEQRTDVELTVLPGASVMGRVLSVSGAALEGVRVIAWSRVARTTLRCGEARTDVDGGFVLAGLPPGDYSIAAQHDDFARVTERMSLSEGARAELEFELEPSPGLWGRVVDRDGYAVSNARVRALPRDAHGEADEQRGLRTSWCDEFGFFALERLEPGRYLLEASAVGHERIGAPPIVSVPADVEFELVLASTRPRVRAVLRGAVVLEDGGLPEELRFEGARGGAVEHEGGRFRITGVQPGRVQLRVRAAGTVEQVLAPLELAPGSEHDYGLVRLAPATRLIVHVRAADGAGLRGARVRLSPLPVEQGGRGSDAPTLRASESGAAGRYTFTGVPRAGYLLRVDLRGYVSERRRIVVEPQASQSGGPQASQSVSVELAPQQVPRQQVPR